MTMRSRRMAGDEVRDYLDAGSGSEWGLLATLDAEGYPHVVPLGYFRDGDDILLGTPDGSQKVRNAERDPRGSLTVTGARAGGDLSGVLLQGDLEVVRDPAARLELERDAHRRRGGAEEDAPTEARPGAVYLRLRPKRTITWRYD